MSCLAQRLPSSGLSARIGNSRVRRESLVNAADESPAQGGVSRPGSLPVFQVLLACFVRPGRCELLSNRIAAGIGCCRDSAVIRNV